MTDDRTPRMRRWAPAGAMFAPNPEFRAGHAFASTDHLAADAVVAYVDGVLPGSARGRVDEHLRLCPGCAAEVSAQTDARSLLRGCGEVHAPSTLIGQLSQIPTREFDVRDVRRRSR